MVRVPLVVLVKVTIGRLRIAPVVIMLFIVYEEFSLAPKGSPVTRADTDAFLLNSALLTVKSMLVSAVAEVPAVSTAAATRITVFGSTYSYVVPASTWSDVAPAARKMRFLTNGIVLLLILYQLYSFGRCATHWGASCGGFAYGIM